MKDTGNGEDLPLLGLDQAKHPPVVAKFSCGKEHAKTRGGVVLPPLGDLAYVGLDHP
jgi:hypothetical protein